jgi:hypothetical protein
MRSSTPSRIRTVAIATSVLLLLPVAGCRKNSRGKSSLAQWIEEPTSGTTQGSTIRIPDLEVKFEIPDTLYVYKTCGEASHAADGETNWVPVITCRTGASQEAFSSGKGDEEEEDPFADDEAEELSGVEDLDITFYVTNKTRPLDERAVTWFENNYKQAGLSVDEISYQHDFQKKAGIYAKLHVIEQGETAPTREIVQFMFPRKDVVFIARMEYPFGETRSIDQDWKYILWNFEFEEGGEK